ncbi:MAG: GNAT family N-acetyltransferase [Planctomycetes bacterium]|nr:GNAT family N-acetyltransferase [Planctomycetota bacterium]
MELHLLEILADGRPDTEVSLSEVARGVCDAMAALYRQTGYLPPWIGYLALLDGEIVGTCAFKSPPRDGCAEIAYFTFPGHERRGIATEMARRLVELARNADQRVIPTAQTLPEENASTAILRRLGFIQTGIAHDPEVGEVWAWERLPN